VSYIPIYLPDGERFSVEWYISDGKATGVWVEHRVEQKKQVGFVAPRRDRERPS
jgi:hypothetical protein